MLYEKMRPHWHSCFCFLFERAQRWGDNNLFSLWQMRQSTIYKFYRSVCLCVCLYVFVTSTNLLSTLQLIPNSGTFRLFASVDTSWRSYVTYKVRFSFSALDLDLDLQLKWNDFKSTRNYTIFPLFLVSLAYRWETFLYKTIDEHVPNLSNRSWFHRRRSTFKSILALL